MIPLFVLEEHHEAFLAWHYAAEKRYINQSGNMLFHIDEHADMNNPRFNNSIQEHNGDLRAVHRFVHNELTIATFLIAAVYDGLIGTCFWIRHTPIATEINKNGLVCSVKGEGERLLYVADTPENRMVYSDARPVELKFVTRYNQFPAGEDVILDIDLDYFSSNTPPDGFEGRVETTRDEYESFVSDQYHYLRVAGHRITPVHDNGRYWFVFNRIDRPLTSDTRVGENEIVKRIDAFFSFLEEKDVRPSCIDISRSRHSHYTPPDQWEMIESNVIAGLKKLYDPAIMTIADIEREIGASLSG